MQQQQAGVVAPGSDLSERILMYHALPGIRRMILAFKPTEFFSLWMINN